MASFTGDNTVRVTGHVTDANGSPQANKMITCRSANCSNVTTTTSAEGGYSVHLLPDRAWSIQLGGIGVENKIIEVFVSIQGISNGDADIVTDSVTGSIRVMHSNIGCGVTKPADVHVGLTEKTIASLQQNITLAVKAAHQLAQTVHDLKQNSNVPEVAITAQLNAMRKQCNLYAQYKVCLRTPPPELKALHDTFTGSTSVMSLPEMTGSEVDFLEQELFQELMNTRVNISASQHSLPPPAETASRAENIAFFADAMKVDMEVSAQKYSVSNTSGLFANW